MEGKLSRVSDQRGQVTHDKMRRVRRSNASVLNLVLTYKWYDMIDKGDKREEYRAYDTWCGRVRSWIRKAKEKGNGLLVVAFQRAYKKPTMWWLVGEVATSGALKARGERSAPKAEWGEPELHFNHYVIKLAERVELVDE